LLADAVYSSSFIPERATKDLIQKLQATQSEHFSRRIKSMTFVKPDVKTANRELFYSIEMLDDAVSRGVRARFDYLRYDLNKTLVPRREEKYTVSPYAIVWANEKYYLICYYGKYGAISHFRIDKIKSIELTTEKAVPLPKGFSPYDYAKASIYMYGNEIARITLLCDMKILDDVIDRFGKDAAITPFGKDRFKATVRATADGIRFWALQYLQFCEVLTPVGLRRDIAGIIKNGVEKYS
ncbi:MAG: WYL domain-containing protein, partial [Clostridiales bacterium]|nr:WYL domain-containing protein [Clostridiales bacterium]